jgi:hypothetical protein
VSRVEPRNNIQIDAVVVAVAVSRVGTEQSYCSTLRFSIQDVLFTVPCTVLILDLNVILGEVHKGALTALSKISCLLY